MTRIRPTRRSFLKAAGLGAAALAVPNWLRAAAAAAGSQDKPNIVIVMVDDMGFSDIGCYGSEIKTPHLDALAANGLRFTQFYNTGRCCPTRASLLTGLYSHQAGVGHMTGDYNKPGYLGHLADRCVTIAEVLKPAGYRTLMTGKWHVGAAPGQRPPDRGFDRFYGVPEGGGFYFKPKPGRTIMLDRTVRHTHNSGPMPAGWYSSTAWTRWGLKFIAESVQMRKPFFLYLAHNAPHWPLQAPPEAIAKYRGRYKIGWDKLRLQRHARQIEMGIVKKDWPLTPRDPKSPAWESLTDEQRDKSDHLMAAYAAVVELMDASMGQLVAGLEKLGVLDNTLVLFLADNGGCAEGGVLGTHRGKGPVGSADAHDAYGLAWANASNTPFRRYKHWVHEGGCATPLIAHWPRVIEQKGQLTHQVGHLVDLMATCCDVVGATYPREFKGKQIVPLEGKSLLPVFQGKQRAGHAAVFWEHEGNRAVRQGRWKLVSKHPGKWELYDMNADRTELNDLAATKPEIARKLKSAYDAWAQRSYVVPWPARSGGKTGGAKRKGARKKKPTTGT